MSKIDILRLKNTILKNKADWSASSLFCIDTKDNSDKI